jgi:hypothetical protein
VSSSSETSEEKEGGEPFAALGRCSQVTCNLQPAVVFKYYLKVLMAVGPLERRLLVASESMVEIHEKAAVTSSARGFGGQIGPDQRQNQKEGDQ